MVSDCKMLTTGLVLLVLTGISYGMGCYSPAIPDICQSQEPQIPELQSRHPSIWFSNETESWTYCDLYAINLSVWYKSPWNMTTTCPGKYKCGTKFPVWMNGDNPSANDGLVNRTACLRFEDNCCYESFSIAAVNCGQFMAYCFNQELSACHERYCFDVEQTSSTASDTAQSASSTSSYTVTTSNDTTPTSVYTVESSSTSSATTTKPTPTFVLNRQDVEQTSSTASDTAQLASSTSSYTVTTSNDTTPTSVYTVESSSTSSATTIKPTPTFVLNRQDSQVGNDSEVIIVLTSVSVLSIATIIGLIVTIIVSAIVRHKRNPKLENMTKDRNIQMDEESVYEKIRLPGVHVISMTDDCRYATYSCENDDYMVAIGSSVSSRVSNQTYYDNTANPVYNEEYYQTIT